MSLISDFIIATPDEAGSIDLDRSPANDFPSVAAARVEVVKISRLQSLIEGKPIEEYLPKLDTLIVRGGDEGPWLIKIPDSIFESLSAVDVAGAGELARRWSETEEWQSDGGTAENLTPFLWQLAQLAKKGKTQNRDLYIWISL